MLAQSNRRLHAMRASLPLLGLLLLALVGCASATTASTVSAGDLPAVKYRDIVVFVENVDTTERMAAEQLVVSALKHAGVRAAGSVELFGAPGQVGENEMAAIIRDQNFGAVLYITVRQKEIVDEPVPDVTWDGQMFHGSAGPLSWGYSASATYVVASDGSVVRPVMTLATEAELQDVASAKDTWRATTTASGNAKWVSMTSLFEEVSNQIVDKLRADNAI
jgi:hypothetical protein